MKQSENVFCVWIFKFEIVNIANITNCIGIIKKFISKTINLLLIIFSSSSHQYRSYAIKFNVTVHIDHKLALHILDSLIHFKIAFVVIVRLSNQ
jgi:hypothetical protein